MSKWKLFGRLKPKQDEMTERSETIKEEIKDIKIDPEKEDRPLAEYHETLHTSDFTFKKGKKTAQTDQRIWRDVNSIENKIDNLHKVKAQKPASEVDKTVDRLIAKQKKK